MLLTSSQQLRLFLSVLSGWTVLIAKFQCQTYFLPLKYNEHTTRDQTNQNHPAPGANFTSLRNVNFEV